MLVTEWPEFKALDLRELASRMAHPVLIDGRNLFDPEAARKAGFDYGGIGRGAKPNGNDHSAERVNPTREPALIV